jgi:hypothetical protein
VVAETERRVKVGNRGGILCSDVLSVYGLDDEKRKAGILNDSVRRQNGPAERSTERLSRNKKKKLLKYGKLNDGEVPRVFYHHLITEGALLEGDMPQHKEERTTRNLIDLLGYRKKLSELRTQRILQVFSQSLQMAEPDPVALDLNGLCSEFLCTRTAEKWCRIMEKGYSPSPPKDDFINDSSRHGELARIQLATRNLERITRSFGNGVEKLTVDVLDR